MSFPPLPVRRLRSLTHVIYGPLDGLVLGLSWGDLALDTTTFHSTESDEHVRSPTRFTDVKTYPHLTSLGVMWCQSSLVRLRGTSPCTSDRGSNGSTGVDVQSVGSSLVFTSSRRRGPNTVKVTDDDSMKGVKTDTSGDEVRSRRRG